MSAVVREIIERNMLGRTAPDGAGMAMQELKAKGLLRDYPHLEIEGDWLVEVVDEHTCGTGPNGHYGLHEPGCGTVPVAQLNRPEGAQAVKRAWLNAGPVPSFHYAWMRKVREGWPALAAALDRL